jgi:hypothetical protein
MFSVVFMPQSFALIYILCVLTMCLRSYMSSTDSPLLPAELAWPVFIFIQGRATPSPFPTQGVPPFRERGGPLPSLPLTTLLYIWHFRLPLTTTVFVELVLQKFRVVLECLTAFVARNTRARLRLEVVFRTLMLQEKRLCDEAAVALGALVRLRFSIKRLVAFSIASEISNTVAVYNSALVFFSPV